MPLGLAIVMVGAVATVGAAVIAATAAYVLQRARFREERRKAHQADIRRMVEAEFQRGRRAASQALVAAGSAFQDPTAGPEEAVPSPNSPPLWQPDRIPEASLRDLARQYTALRSYVEGVARYGTEDARRNLPQRAADLPALEKQITTLMDQLGNAVATQPPGTR